MVKTDDWVLQRIEQLRRDNEDVTREKWRIRAIMNGGVDGIIGVMLWDRGQTEQTSRSEALAMLGTDLPTVNLMYTGLERLAQKIGRIPMLKAPLTDDDNLREKAEERVSIVRDWDENQKMALTIPQIARWIPGYSFAQLHLTQARNRHQEWYPQMRMRDPYDVTPGYFGADQQPSDFVYTRVIPLYVLHDEYPELDWVKLDARIEASRGPKPVGGIIDVRAIQGAVKADNQRSWEGPQTGVKVCQYVCGDGSYLMIPELGIRLHYVPNVLDRMPFAFGKRFSFDQLQSHYKQVIGMVGQLAKLNILGMIASEDSVFRETNIVGSLVGKRYERGRLAVNEFEPGTQISRPTGDQAQQIWAQIDRLERQVRIGENYDVQQDGTSPNSFATGQGMRELQSAGANNEREYQLVMQHMMLDADAVRLEYAEKMYGSSKRQFYDMRGKLSSYNPKQKIKGDYRTRRIYGAMATFDDQLKVVVGLQLLQGNVMDVETFQENLDGFEGTTVMNERIARANAKSVLFQRLASRSEGDPRADAALVEVMNNPGEEDRILKEYFAPEPEEGEDGMAMAFPPEAPGAGGGLGAPPEQFSTVLSRLEGGGSELGVQTVGNLG